MLSLSHNLFADQSLGWSPAIDFCTWVHITCSNGRITSIQIDNQSLTSTLSKDIGNLTALIHLELHSNQIHGDLPSLSTLSSLQALFLHNNLFSSIPASFLSGLTSLTAVCLDNNPFTPWEIPATLRDVGGLVNFSANLATVSGSVPKFLATDFASLNHLGLAFNIFFGFVPYGFGGSSTNSLWLNNQHKGASLTGGRFFSSTTSSPAVFPAMNVREATDVSLGSNVCGMDDNM